MTIYVRNLCTETITYIEIHRNHYTMNRITENFEKTISAYDLQVLETNFLRSKVEDDFKSLKEKYEFQLFHLTITWLRTQHDLNTKKMNKQFEQFYTRNLIPYAISKRRVSSSNRRLQPIAVCFIEDGKDENKNIRHKGNCALLHHHCIIAAKGIAASNLTALCGTNTIKPKLMILDRSNCDNFEYICTSDLKEITNPSVQLYYPSKNLWKFKEESMLRFNYPFCEDIIDSFNHDAAHQSNLS